MFSYSSRAQTLSAAGKSGRKAAAFVLNAAEPEGSGEERALVVGLSAECLRL